MYKTIMKTSKDILVVDSWDITSYGIIAALSHSLNGLENGLIIKSVKTGQEWQVKKRLFFYHTSEKQRKFPTEVATYVHSKFDSIESQISSYKMILNKEDQHIFQYQLQSIGRNSKPIKGDTLIPVTK